MGLVLESSSKKNFPGADCLTSGGVIGDRGFVSIVVGLLAGWTNGGELTLTGGDTDRGLDIAFCCGMPFPVIGTERKYDAG